MSEPARIIDLTAVHKLQGLVAPESPPAWSYEDIAGRLVELSSDSGSACLTLAFGLVLEAQHLGDPVAWVLTQASTFYPPDVEGIGVDLNALAVVRACEARQLARAADHLVRSGAFGLVVLDYDGAALLSTPQQTRLLGLAQKQHTGLVLITHKKRDAPSLGSLITLRGQTRMQRTGNDRFECELDVVKDKRRSPGWSHVEVCRGPAGMH